MEETFSELRDFIAMRVRKGFESMHEIVEHALDWASDRYERDDLLPKVKRLTVGALAEHQAEQAGWGPSTDCDRLDEAFAALNRQGIVARQDFSCCNTCGFAEIWDEVEAEEKIRPVTGYVFYHLQGTERAIETGQLLMAYGCIEEGPESLNRVASAVVAELQRVGLKASWGGTDRHPVIVEGIIWRRRRQKNPTKPQRSD
ncbi:MAG: hypothetical protein JNM56_12005 [Planctomycetia bacterium]|nr:hypothetical protein [Planctomycetia bacterium]